MSQVAKDLFCGWLSGIGQVLTMMPFENIKIKIVSKPLQYTGIVQTFQKTLAEEGLMSFYKGMFGNLFGVGPQVALQFGTVETMKKYFKRTFEPEKQHLSIHYTAISGMAAGLPSALVVTPLDHARFRVALSKQKIEGGSLGIGKRIYAQYGLRKLYLGFASTLFRQSCALGIYFTTYHFLTKLFSKDANRPSIGTTIISGGTAGVFTWLATYPIDFVKTLVQCDSLQNPRHTSMVGYLKQEVQKGSIKSIFRGIQIMLIRAFVVNGTGFLCFEIGKKIVYPEEIGHPEEFIANV